MAGVPNRRLLPDLFTRLSRERDEADIWVEGTSDARILTYLLRLNGMRRARCYIIDDLYLPSSLSTTTDLPGNKDRLLIASRQVEQELGADIDNIVFIVDRDFDVFRKGNEYGSLVVPTDGTCMEAYMWDEATLDRVATLTLGAVGLDSAAMLSNLRPVLEELFLIKAAQHGLEIRQQIRSARRDLNVSAAGEVDFDREGYITRLLNAGSAASMRDQLESAVAELRLVVAGARYPMFNGHDFVDLLGAALRPLCASSTRPMLAPESLARALLLATDWRDVQARSRQLGKLFERLERFREP